MADLPRLNGVIRALEAGQHALTCFAPAEINSAVAMSASKFDGCVFEMEHNPWDGRLLRDCLQYMLNRAQIAKAASLVPGVTPMVRIPVNGVEMAQWQAKGSPDADANGRAGSAVVHRQPGGHVCIVPVGAQHRGRLFLPFADDDPRTAEVLSKVILLARDHEIQDPTILDQLR